MASFTTVQNSFYRGTTILFLVTFYDVNGNVVQPVAASLNIVYQVSSGGTATFNTAMTPPPGGTVQWTAQWDSTGASAGPVFWSIETATPIPVVVQDGNFLLTANLANIS